MATLAFTEDALAHIRAIGRYTEQTWGVTQRNAYLGKIFSGCERIRQSPDKGKFRAELDEGLRSLRVEKHVIYYYVHRTQRREEVRIIGVLHGRMEPSLHIRVQ